MDLVRVLQSCSRLLHHSLVGLIDRATYCDSDAAGGRSIHPHPRLGRGSGSDSMPPLLAHPNFVLDHAVLGAVVSDELPVQGGRIGDGDAAPAPLGKVGLHKVRLCGSQARALGCRGLKLPCNLSARVESDAGLRTWLATSDSLWNVAPAVPTVMYVTPPSVHVRLSMGHGRTCTEGSLGGRQAWAHTPSRES